MAATLFADPPTSTMEEARDHFLAAEDLKPDGWKENRQFLAKCFISLKDYKTAVEWLDKADALTVNNPDVSRNKNFGIRCTVGARIPNIQILIG